MPRYHSLGIAATLTVSDLDQTLSNEIDFRMGALHQENAKRIQSQLSDGRALKERPIGPNNPEVGVLQFLGRDQDMVFMLVEASDKKPEDQGAVVDRDLASTNVEPTSLASQSDITPSRLVPPEYSTSRKKSKVSGSRRKKTKKGTTHDQTAATAAEPSTTRKQPNNPTDDLSNQLALCITVDLTKFYQKEKKDMPLLSGKDLKLEIFINGELVEVGYSSSRPYKRADVIQFSGTRFHRQAEKPWVYIPSPHDVGNTPARWTDVSNALKQEASTRGVNAYNLRPVSAQFLVALARSQIPEDLSVKGQQFAVVDLVVTAGKGRKFGPDTSYLTGPTRLSDANFSGLAHVIDDVGPFFDQDGDIILGDGFPPFDCDGVTPFVDQFARATDRVVQNLLAQPHTSPTPRTPTTTHMKGAEKYKNILDATPMRKLLLEYENAKGNIKGKRTLRQRLGDMTKMSPSNRQKVLSSMKHDIDEETMTAIVSIFNSDAPKAVTPEQKQVRFKGNEAPARTGGTHGDVSMPDAPATAVDPLSRTLPQINPFWLENESFVTSTQFHDTTARDAGSEVYPVGSFPPFSYLTPQKKKLKKTPASALSNSPTSIPVKHHHTRRNHPSPTQLIDPSLLNTQPDFVRDSSTLRTPSPPVAQQESVTGSVRTSKKWYPEEQTSEQALANFEVPQHYAGSTVTYAKGLKQRQVNKARGGEFEEQHLVVGMRFIVL